MVSLAPSTAGLGTLRARRRRLVRVGAALISVLLHVAFVGAALWSATSFSLAGGAGAAGGEGDAVVVSLVGPIGRDGRLADADTAARSAAAARLDALLLKVRADQPEALPVDKPQPRQGDLGQLFDQIAQSHAPSRAGQGDNGQAARAAKPSGAQASGAASQAAEHGDKGHATGDMWAQIQPCWRPQTAVAVMLEVVIDGQGRLVVPPRILRPANARLDETRLVAEARAVQAVAACAPFRSGLPLFGRATYRFAFTPR